MKSTRIAPGVAALFLLACGPSYWRAQLTKAADLQEVSVSGQAAAKDAASKQAWLTCNALTVLLGERIQVVLDRRADEARGATGAAKALSDAEHAADAVYPLTMDACGLAKKIGVALGAPAPVSPPVAVPVSPPATPAPTGGAVPGLSAPSSPVVAPVAPPVGVPSPVVTP